MLPQGEKSVALQRKLILGTVETVSDLGLENTTTNAICKACDTNVAYIYRFFDSKEDLIAKSFADVDEKLLKVIMKNYTVLNYESIDFESRCHVLFMKCWDYLINHRQEVIFYIRYYYSLSFQKYAYKDHTERYSDLLTKMKTAFPKTADVRLVMHHILDTLLGEAIKQVMDPKDDDNTAASKTFFLIFSVVKCYVKQEKFNDRQ